MIRKALSLLVAAAAIATLGATSPAKAATPIGGAVVAGYTKLSTGALAYVNLGVTDYGTSLVGSLRIVSGNSWVAAKATSIKYDVTNKSHVTVGFVGVTNTNMTIGGSLDVYLDNAALKTGRFGFSMYQMSGFSTMSTMIASATVASLQGNVWVLAP